ncbi:MAG: helix-turn-helix transcriptional regulator [Solobacterium sp.]|nr:helix-turn-helix transcriptional regulator [Solobacterium sp.]
MPVIQYNEICDIFFRSCSIPAGLFDADHHMIVLSSAFGERQTGMYMEDCIQLLERPLKEDSAMLCLDRNGSAWCIILHDHQTVLFGPAQVGFNPDFPYDRIPEMSAEQFFELCQVFVRLILGKDALLSIQSDALSENYTAGQQFESEQEDFEMMSFDEIFDCVRHGDTSELNAFLKSSRFTDYQNRVMYNPENAHTVFIFCLAKTYHTALETGIPIRDLSPLISLHLNEMHRFTTPASYSAGMQRMLYDFTRYVGHYRSGTYSMIVNMANMYIREHVYSQISIEEIAEHCAMSVSALQHRFKKETGQSVSDAILNCKIEKACFFLRNTSLPCTAIAFKLGYCSQSYFNRQFRKVMGVTPSRFRSAGAGLRPQ